MWEIKSFTFLLNMSSIKAIVGARSNRYWAHPCILIAMRVENGFDL